MSGSSKPATQAAPGWTGRELPDYVLVSPWELTQDDLVRKFGGGFPDAIRDGLRAFAEGRLGVGTLHTWADRTENTTLIWTFEFTAPPPLPYSRIADDTGAALSGEDIIQAR